MQGCQRLASEMPQARDDTRGVIKVCSSIDQIVHHLKCCLWIAVEECKLNLCCDDQALRGRVWNGLSLPRNCHLIKNLHCFIGLALCHQSESQASRIRI